MVVIILGKMEAEKLTVYCNTELEAAATRRVAKALVDCKVSRLQFYSQKIGMEINLAVWGLILASPKLNKFLCMYLEIH